MTCDESEPTYPLTLLVEVEHDHDATREQLQALVDDVLVDDARGGQWAVRRFFDDPDLLGQPEGYYEVSGLIPVSPSYPIRALGFDLATRLTEAMADDLAGQAMPDFPSTAFDAEVDEVDEVDEFEDSGAELAGMAVEAAAPSWALEVMRCREAWELPPAPGGAQRGQGIVIGHPDTGFTWHRELTGSLDLTRDYDIIGKDRIAEDPLKKRRWWPFDSPGHGTSTGSVIISSEADLITGTAPDSTLVPFRAVRSVIQVSDGDVARAIDRARTAGAHVISMSLGGVGFYSGIRAAIGKARDAGIIVMAAAGNKVRIVVAPARFEECIAVAGTDRQNRPWSGSSRGGPVLISAPGHRVPMAKARKGSKPSDPGTAASVSSGTSYAVAHLAGIAALWLAHHGRDALIARYGPRGIQEAFEEILTTSGFSRPAGWDDDWGVGIVDAVRVLSADLPDPSAAAEAVDASAPAPGAVERLAEIGIAPGLDPRGALRSMLHCDDAEVDELARCHGAELAYLYAEGELPTPALDAATETAAEAPPSGVVMSPRLRARLEPA